MGRHSAPTKRELRAAAAAAKKAATAETLAAEQAASAATPAVEPQAVDATPTTAAPTTVVSATDVEASDQAVEMPTSDVEVSGESGAPATDAVAPSGPEAAAEPETVTVAASTAHPQSATVKPTRLPRAPLGVQVRRPHTSNSKMTRYAAVGIGAAVLGATVGFVNLSKHVDVVIDGKQQSVTTYAADVEGVLTDAGVDPGPNDAVTPSLDSKVTDGGTVSLVKSRDVSVVIDGEATVKTVTAYTTQEAVEQLGLADQDVVSSRSQRLPLTGATIEIATYDDVSVAVDGDRTTVSTAADDVEGALTDAGVTLGEHDTVSPGLDEKVTAGMNIKVTRVDQQQVTETRTIAHKKVEKDNPDEYIGIDEVVTDGADGTEKVTFLISTVDGEQTSKTEESSEVTKEPVDEVTSKGTKEFPAEVNALNWEALGYCESTNNPKAVNQQNHMYFGEYQFSEQTWAGVGGTGNPADAPAEEQLARAKILFMQYGASQWECGSHLYD
ncbi:MAG: ubiquitin-like domain-containing protein [Cumulibacter sp.]